MVNPASTEKIKKVLTNTSIRVTMCKNRKVHENMDIEQTIKEIITKKGYTQKSLATKLGYGHTSGVSEKLRRKGGMRIDTLVKFLTAMDCEIVIRSKTNRDEWKIDVE